jgi:uncharacterized protein YegP (UPF0339 family)
MFSRRSLLAAFAVVPFLALSAAAADKKMTFEVYADSKNEYRWRLKDGDGANVATSGQGYGKKADCMKMVENFKADISKYDFELYEDKSKEQRFRLKAKNGNTVGSSSSSYKTKADAEKVIAAIKAGAKDAQVKELPKE